MGGVIVVLLLLLLGGGVFLFLYMSKSNASSASETPVTAPEGVRHSDGFIPQETIYSYHNSTPGMNCPNCDAESPSGMTFCQVCGARLDRTKFT